MKEKVMDFWNSQSKQRQDLVKIVALFLILLWLLRGCGDEDTEPIITETTVREIRTVQEEDEFLKEEPLDYSLSEAKERTDYEYLNIQDSRLIQEHLKYLMSIEEFYSYKADDLRLAYNTAMDDWFTRYFLRKENDEYVNIYKYLNDE